MTRQDQPSATTPLRSLITRAIRWISGADRKEATAQAQTLTKRKSAERRIQEQGGVREKSKATRQTDSEVHEVSSEPTGRGKSDAVAHSDRVSIAAESLLPIIRVETATGGIYYVRRADWLTARSQNLTNVPTCNWRGDPVPPSSPEKATLRLTTIENSTLIPMAVVDVGRYLVEGESDQNLIL